MPDITFPNTLVAAATTDADKVTQNIFDPHTTPDSLDVLNGWLDSDNIDSGIEIERVMLQQRNALSFARMVGATANLDYFHDWFIGNTSTDDSACYVPLSGANATFRLPWSPSISVLFWMVTLLENGDSITKAGGIRLYVDGVSSPTYNASYRRIANGGVFASRAISRNRIRHYSGHWLIEDWNAGFHTAGLRLMHAAPGSENGNCRAYCRNFGIVAFK